MPPSRSALLALLFLPATLSAQSAQPAQTAQTSQTAQPSQTGGAAEASGPPVVSATRATGPIDVDGRLDEELWSAAPPVTSFTQIDPEEGQPVSERTEARLLYDDGALYVGVRMDDSEPVSARLGRRDMDLSDADWLGIVIDSYHDHRTAFSFQVNPAGVQRDAAKSMGAGGVEVDDLSRDAVWQVMVTTDDKGWTAELRIPFSQLRFGTSVQPVWGIQIERIIGRRSESAVFSFTPKSKRGGIPTYGHLEGLRDVKPGQRLEVLPYVVGRAEFVDPRANPYRTNSEYFKSGGVDMLYRVNSHVAVNATINPDFGQVEVDPAVINLTVYETFFDEKRPFFIEGSEIFDFGKNTSGGQLLYTRRIGRRPQVSSPSTQFDMPDTTTILGAGKLSGKTTSGWSFGALEAVTAEEQVRYLDLARADRSAVAEPMSNYFVGRVRRDGRAGRSSFGAMLTAVNRWLTTDALRAGLRESAYAAGIDFRNEWANRTWVLRGSFVGSRINGDARSITAVERSGNHFFQRPDAEHLEVNPGATSLTGYSTGLALGKQAGRHWRGELAAAATSPQFEVNDLGYQNRTDRRDVAFNMVYQENTPGSFLRSYSVTGATRYEHNTAWQRILATWSLTALVTHLNFWNVSIASRYQVRNLDDRATRGGPLMERPPVWTLSPSFNSDPRRPVTLKTAFSIGGDPYGASTRTASVSLGLKTSPRWNMTVSPTLTRSYSLAQYVSTVPDKTATDTYGARYLFAPLRQTSVAMETRLDVTFTPRLSLQLYAQPLISSGDYQQVGALTTPQGYQFTRWDGAAPNLDFNLRSLRGTAVLRWEWRPGSTMYFAWQQSRADNSQGVGDFELGRDGRAMFAAKPDSVFVLKVNYRIAR